MKTLTWISIVLTLWVSVDLGERAYVYYKVSEINRARTAAAVEACIHDNLRNLDPVVHDSMRKFYLDNDCSIDRLR